MYSSSILQLPRVPMNGLPNVGPPQDPNLTFTNNYSLNCAPSKFKFLSCYELVMIHSKYISASITFESNDNTLNELPPTFQMFLKSLVR